MDKKSKKETGNNEEPQTVNTAKKTVKERLDDLLKKEDMEEKAVAFRERKDPKREKVKKTATLKEKKRE